MSKFAIRFKKEREQRGWTQDDVAEKLGLQRSTIAGYESVEKNRIPREETLNDIADLFNTSIDYMLGRTDDRTPTLNYKKILPTLQQRLKETRTKYGLSIEELAEKIGWQPDTLTALEENPKKIPGQRTLDKLAEALDVTRDYLLGYTDDPKGYGTGVYHTDPTDLKEFIAKNKTLNYGGDVVDLDEETKAFFDQQMRMAFHFVKERNKEKYGRKKGSTKGE